MWDDWSFLNDSSARIEAVTAEDVQRVANAYFTDEGRNALWYLRKEGTEEDPELAALSAQGKAMAKQALAQINQVTEPAELEQGLAQMQTMAAPGAAGVQAGDRPCDSKSHRTPRSLKASAGEGE